MIRFLALSASLIALLPAPRVEAESGPLISLEEAYDRTLASDQAIAIAHVAIDRARLEPLAAWTKLSPQLNATATLADRSQRSGSSTTSTGTSTGSSTSIGSRTASNAGGLSLEQPILDFSFFPAYRRGVVSVEAARMDFRAKIREVLYGVAEAYYNVLSQQQVVQVDQEAVRLADEQWKLAQKRASVGEVTRSDVLRAQVTLESAKRTLVKDASDLASRHNILANILNLPPETPFRVAAPTEQPATLATFSSLLHSAQAHREDLRSRDLVIEQNLHSEKEARANYAPKVIAQVDGTSSDQGAKSGDFDNEWTASLGLRVPLFSGGQRRIDIKTAQLQTAQSRLEREQFAKAVEQEVKDAWLNVKSLAESLESLKVQVAAAEQSYKDLQSQYSAGTATSVDVLSALNDLNTARKDLAVETLSLQLGLRKLQQVAGTFQEQRVNNVRLK